MEREDRVQTLVIQALNTLLVRDGELLERDVDERAITDRLAVHLEPLFPDFHVDAEYNKHGLDPKDVTLPQECRAAGHGLIRPDIVVHRRGNDDNNLLVLEIKKATNRESRACDRAKIDALNKEYRYEYGVLIVLPGR